MLTLRRSPEPLPPSLWGRAGMVAFAVALLLGGGLGLLLGTGATRQAEKEAEVRIGEALESAQDLRRGLDERHRALDLLTQVPSVLERQGSEAQAFASLRRIYPEFEEVRIETGDRRPSAPPSAAPGGPRRLRLVSPLRGGDHLVGILAKDWPQRVVADKGRFGTQDAITTAVVSPRGARTAATALPPAWERLQSLGESGYATLKWSDGRTYLTSIRRLERRTPHGVQPAVVSGVPTSRIATRAGKVRRIAWGFGLVLGALAGGLAWFGIARSTRRLRAANLELERRVSARTAELALAESSYRALFENAPFGLYQCDLEGRFVRVNPTLADTLGYASPQAMVSALGAIQAIGERGDRERFVERLRATGEATGVVEVLTAAGRSRWLQETARVVRAADGSLEAIEGAMHDVTDQHELEAQLRRIGATDPLTGLMNRRGLEEAIGAAESPVSFVALDLDSFKAYNDAYGHLAGDHALRTVADAIRRSVRAGDAVARLGGEEFVLVLPRTGAEGAQRVAEALRVAVASCEGLEARLTVSGGVATAREPEDLDEAFAAADRALYRAKDAGRNRIVVNSAMLT